MVKEDEKEKEENMASFVDISLNSPSPQSPSSGIQIELPLTLGTQVNSSDNIKELGNEDNGNIENKENINGAQKKQVKFSFMSSSMVSFFNSSLRENQRNLQVNAQQAGYGTPTNQNKEERNERDQGYDKENLNENKNKADRAKGEGIGIGMGVAAAALGVGEITISSRLFESGKEDISASKIDINLDHSHSKRQIQSQHEKMTNLEGKGKGYGDEDEDGGVDGVEDRTIKCQQEGSLTKSWFTKSNVLIFLLTLMSAASLFVLFSARPIIRGIMDSRVLDAIIIDDLEHDELKQAALPSLDSSFARQVLMESNSDLDASAIIKSEVKPPKIVNRNEIIIEGQINNNNDKSNNNNNDNGNKSNKNSGNRYLKEAAVNRKLDTFEEVEEIASNAKLRTSYYLYNITNYEDLEASMTYYRSLEQQLKIEKKKRSRAQLIATARVTTLAENNNGNNKYSSNSNSENYDDSSNNDYNNNNRENHATKFQTIQTIESITNFDNKIKVLQEAMKSIPSVEPIVESLGPFTYKDTEFKTDLVLTPDREVLSYNTLLYQQYLPQESTPTLTLEDTIYTINPAYITAMSGTGNEANFLSLLTVGGLQEVLASFHESIIPGFKIGATQKIIQLSIDKMVDVLMLKGSLGVGYSAGENNSNNDKKMKMFWIQNFKI